MEENDLLMMAAKAAGLEAGVIHQRPHRKCDMGWTPWNPLEDDGDALRLSVKLRMRVEAWGSGASAVVSVDNRALVAEPHYGEDPDRATRRAIVRAAAAMAA